MHRLKPVRRARAWNHRKRRVDVLARTASELIPSGSSVLDIGCGDGTIDRKILDLRPDVRIQGCDIVSWSEPEIEVVIFKDLPLPFGSNTFDCALLIDVIHHANDPLMLLKEAIRTTRKHIIIKDHLTDRWLAEPILRFMDRTGNEEQGVSLPYKFWSMQEWTDQFESHDLELQHWSTDIPIYPWWADWLFGRGLHFSALLKQL